MISKRGWILLKINTNLALLLLREVQGAFDRQIDLNILGPWDRSRHQDWGCVTDLELLRLFQEALEAYLVGLFEDTNLPAVAAENMLKSLSSFDPIL